MALKKPKAPKSPKTPPEVPAGKAAISWPTEVRPIDELLPADYNPRKITQHALVGLRNSIEAFGVMQPVVWNKRTGRVVGGHQRVEALKLLGETEVEVKVVDFSEAQEKAANLSLNNSAIQGTWDDDKLSELVTTLQLEDNFGLLAMQDLRLDDLLAGYIVDLDTQVELTGIADEMFGEEDEDDGDDEGVEDVPPPGAPAVKALIYYLPLELATELDAGVQALIAEGFAETGGECILRLLRERK